MTFSPDGRFALHPTADGSLTIKDRVLEVCFHSIYGAIGESLHVFLEGGQVDRLLELPYATILEIGIGTGLNPLLVAHRQAQLAQGANYIRYVGFEPHPLPQALLRQYYEHNLIVAPTHLTTAQVENWITAWPQHDLIKVSPNFEGFCHFMPYTDTVLAVESGFDRVFYDPYSPGCVPEQWAEAFFLSVYRQLKPGGLLVTYSITGELKRILKRNAIPFDRPAGFGRKREMLVCFRP
jgi:tRNA U34 5-methylaminomethyl-2-thiouridine-forming methyltransferase MnmC